MLYLIIVGLEGKRGHALILGQVLSSSDQNLSEGSHLPQNRSASPPIAHKALHNLPYHPLLYPSLSHSNHTGLQTQQAHSSLMASALAIPSAWSAPPQISSQVIHHQSARSHLLCEPFLLGFLCSSYCTQAHSRHYLLNVLICHSSHSTRTSTSQKQGCVLFIHSTEQSPQQVLTKVCQ